MERATKLIDDLAETKKKWSEAVRQIDVGYDQLPGDCVLSTAFVSYLGPFKYKCREFLVNFWLKLMKENGAPSNPEFEFISFSADPAIIRDWNGRGLSDDRFSIENGIIISQSYRYPFIVDPQSQAREWIENVELDNGLMVIDHRSTNAMRNLEIAIQNGHPALIQIDYEQIDPHVISILSRPIVKKGLSICYNTTRYIRTYFNDNNIVYTFCHRQ